MEPIVRQIEDIQDNRQPTINCTESAAACSHGLAYTIMHNFLVFGKCQVGVQTSDQ